jgi:phosphatidylglycerophosphate synthase
MNETDLFNMNRLRSTGWVSFHAGLCAVAGVVSVALSVPWLLASVGVLSLLTLVASQKPSLPRLGGLGVANAITVCRLALLLVASAAMHASLVFGLVLVLDAVDGAVARRLGEASAFGALLDMETDALFIAVLSVANLVAGAPPWVLLFGALRYALVLSRLVFSAEAAVERRATFGRVAYLVAALSLLAALNVGPSLFSTGLLAFGLAGLFVSFSGDFASLRRA